MLYPQERDEAACETWLRELSELAVEKLVFLDEASSFANASRAYGWAPTLCALLMNNLKARSSV